MRPYRNSWIPGRVSYRQLARNDGRIVLRVRRRMGGAAAIPIVPARWVSALRASTHPTIPRVERNDRLAAEVDSTVATTANRR